MPSAEPSGQAWAFINEGTTKTVGVSGVASDTHGQLLCDDASGAGAAGKPTCEPSDRAVAHVTVSAASGPETGNNPPTGPGTLPSTGAGPVTDFGGSPYARMVCGLTILLVALASALIAWAARRRRPAA